MELDVWRSAGSSYRPAEFSADFGVVGTPPPAIVYEEPGPPRNGLYGRRILRPVGHRSSGFGDTGSVPRMKGRTGRIRTTTIIAKAGNVTRGIGTTRTTTTVIGATIIMGGGIAITTTATKPVESIFLASGMVSHEGGKKCG
jgi:hypothetical protein